MKKKSFVEIPSLRLYIPPKTQGYVIQHYSGTTATSPERKKSGTPTLYLYREYLYVAWLELRTKNTVVRDVRIPRRAVFLNML